MVRKKKRRYTPQQIAIIRRKAIAEKESSNPRDKFPKEFPFWARLKINKNRPTLVIDEEPVEDRKGRIVDGFVHREVIHTSKLKDYEQVTPNPDPKDPDPMYLKRPRKHPQYLFKPHEGGWSIPDDLQKRYEVNNKKNPTGEEK